MPLYGFKADVACHNMLLKAGCSIERTYCPSLILTPKPLIIHITLIHNGTIGGIILKGGEYFKAIKSNQMIGTPKGSLVTLDGLHAE